MNRPLAPRRPTVDLDRCADEPIHIPSAIQPHGAIVAFAEPGLDIEFVSANINSFLAMEPDQMVGASLYRLLSMDTLAVIREALSAIPPDGQNFQVFTLPRTKARGPLNFWIHRHDGRTILEFERPGSPGPSAQDLAKVETAFGQETSDALNVYEIARSTAEAVAEVARYDRVMVYRFLPDWSGEILAEVRRPATTAFLGLRFPASDIPEQARRLYTLNRLRIIVDVDAAPCPVMPAVPPTTGQPLDLSFATLRAVSPVHIQYLQNMGVSGTLVASLIVKGQLWGLIACHHDRPRHVTPAERASVSTIADRAAAAIADAENLRIRDSERRVAHYLASMQSVAATRGNLAQRLMCGDPNLQDVANADGIAIRAGTALVTIGSTPEPPIIERLVSRVAAVPEHFLCSDHLAELDPATLECRDIASGVLAIGLPHQPGVVLLAFRRELVHEVTWGGDPAKPTELDGETLTPRKSFAQWRETVVGRCRPWEAEVVAAWKAVPTWLAGAFGSFTRAGERLNADLVAMRPAAQADNPMFRAVFNIGHATLLLIRNRADDHLRIAAVNRAFRRMFNAVPDNLITRTIPEAIQLLGLGQLSVDQLRSGQTVESTLVSGELGERVLAISHRPFLRYRSTDTDTTAAALVFEDITAARRVEQALRSARDQALIASRTKAEFLATMSHELRTPLNAIIGFSEIMRAELFGTLGSPRYKEYIRHIETSGEHLLKVIGDILDLSKVEAGRYVLEEQAIDIGSLVEELCHVERTQAERAGVRLMQDMAPKPLILQGDERAIRQILLNLLSNSFKFTPSGGMVTLRTLSLPDSAIAVEVQDTGIGIPDEYLQRILDPYVQVSKSSMTRRENSGTGLGLSVVRVLAELHEARISITTQTGRGTTLRVAFPAWRTISQPSIGTAPPGAAEEPAAENRDAASADAVLH